MYDEYKTDHILNKFDVAVQCYVNVNYMSLLAPGLLVAGNPPASVRAAADLMNAVRTSLLQPRKTLSVKFNGSEMIPQQTAGVGTVDAKQGPQPMSCDVLELTNETFLLNFRIVAHYWENNTYSQVAPLVRNQKGNNVLSNRWTETVQMDEVQMSTRTRQGRFVIRADNASGFIADQLRTQFAVVGVPSGFVRESSSYTISPDGLTLSYMLVDKEKFKLPPQPAFKAEGEVIESTGKNGIMRFVEARVRLWGDKQADQAKLVEQVITIIMIKLHAMGAPLVKTDSHKKAILDSAAVRVGMYDNWAECNARAICVSNRKRLSGLNAIRSSICFTPNSDPTLSVTGVTNIAGTPFYQDRGTAKLLLQAAAYHDPSVRASLLNPTTGQMTQGVEIGRAGVTREP